MKNIVYIVIVVIIIAAAAAFYLSLSSPSYIPSPGSEHSKGAANASAVITEFSDFQCPYCKDVQPTINQLLTEYEGEIKLVHKHFPLPSHAYSQKAAEASECAADHGKFWEYHDIVFANQDRLYRNALIEYASEIGLDAENFAACLDSGVMEERVKKDLEEGQRFGVRGTPTFFVNARMLSGNQPLSAFKSAINQELGEMA